MLTQSVGPEEAQRCVKRFAQVGARLHIEAVGAPKDGAWLFGLRLAGRKGRLSFAVGSVLMTAALQVLKWLMLVDVEGHIARSLVVSVLIFAAVYQMLRLAALRCHDIDRSGWWSLLMLVPIVNFVVWIALLARSGTEGDNRHGAEPQPGSVLAVVLAVALFIGIMFAIDRAQSARKAPPPEARMPTAIDGQSVREKRD